MWLAATCGYGPVGTRGWEPVLPAAAARRKEPVSSVAMGGLRPAAAGRRAAAGSATGCGPVCADGVSEAASGDTVEVSAPGCETTTVAGSRPSLIARAGQTTAARIAASAWSLDTTDR